MIVVSDTSPLNYLFETTIERLERETTFYVAKDVLEEFRRRAREHKLAQDQ
jgi:hypothetical protein